MVVKGSRGGVFDGEHAFSFVYVCFPKGAEMLEELVGEVDGLHFWRT